MSQKKTLAPLWAGLAVIILVAGVLIFSNAQSAPGRTVATIQAPAVAALAGGAADYPANSAEAFDEDLKFGYLPAPDLAMIAGGEVVAANPETAERDLPELTGALESVSAEAFAQLRIPPAHEDKSSGTTITWGDLIEEIDGRAVIVAGTEDPAVAEAALDIAAEHEIVDALIIRSASVPVLSAALEAGATALYTGAGDEATPDMVSSSIGGPAMVALPADTAPERIAEFTGAEAPVWLTGLTSAQQLTAAVDAGALGALTADPFSLLPPQVKE